MLIGQKGGSGKSTLATALAAEYQRRGLRTLLVDLDRQGTARDWAALAAESGHEHPHTIAAGPGFADVLESLQGAYDVGIFDLPGRESQLGREAMLAADVALVPLAPSPADVWAASETLTMARQARGLRPALVVRTVVSRADARRRYTRELAAMLAEGDAPPLESVIHDRSDFIAAMAAGQGPTTYAPESKAAEEVRALADEVAELAKLRRTSSRK